MESGGGTINYRLPRRLSSRIPHMTCSGTTTRRDGAASSSDSPRVSTSPLGFAARVDIQLGICGVYSRIAGPVTCFNPVVPPLRPHFKADDRTDCMNGGARKARPPCEFDTSIARDRASEGSVCLLVAPLRRDLN